MHLPRHIGRVATNVEVSFLEQKLVYFFTVLDDAVLNVDFVYLFARESGDEGEFGTECLFMLLEGV